jgi:hypothetical protein
MIEFENDSFTTMLAGISWGSLSSIHEFVLVA